MLVEEKELSVQKGGVFRIFSEPPADWDEFVDLNTGCLFHKERWGKTVAEGYGMQPLYACWRQDGRLALGLHGHIFNFGFFKLFFSAVPYGGLIGEQTLAAEFMDLFEAQLKEKGIHQIRVTQAAEAPFNPLCGYQPKNAQQHLLDLRGKSAQGLMQEYRKNTRRDVKKAVKSGLLVRPIRSAADLDTYYDIYQKTMRRNKALCQYTRNLYRVIYREYLRRGDSIVLFAECQGKPVAAVWLLFAADRAYLLGSVSDPAYLKYCPNDLLIHTAIEETLKRGLNYFDFMMSDEQDRALVFYKEKWGAAKLPFAIWQKDLSLLRCALWRFIWTFSNSNFGSLLINTFRRFHE